MYSLELEVAIHSVMTAVKLCEYARINQKFLIKEKQDYSNSKVTTADFASQAVICKILKSKFPSDQIIGEENSSMLQASDVLLNTTEIIKKIIPEASSQTVPDWIDFGTGFPDKRFWILDPIDGTKGFINGRQYAIALAFVEKGLVKVGVIACPVFSACFPEQPSCNQGILLAAVHGQGIKIIPIAENQHSSNLEVINNLTIGKTLQKRFVESFEPKHGNHELQEKVAHSIGINLPSLRIDSQVKYAAVAIGQASLYLRFPPTNFSTHKEKIWDHAAGSLILEEVGGVVTDMYGEKLDFNVAPELSRNKGIVASRGIDHKLVLNALNPHIEPI